MTRILLSLLALFALAGPAQSATLWVEDFEGMSTTHNPSVRTGGDIAGQNGWTTWSDRATGTADQDGGVEISGVPTNGAYTWDGPDQRGNARALAPGDVPTWGQLRFTSHINVGNDGYSYSGLVLSSGAAGDDALRLIAYSGFIGDNFAAQALGSGGARSDVFTPDLNLDDAFWFQVELTAELAGGVVTGASFRWRDTDQTGVATAAWSAPVAYDLSGVSGLTITHAGFIHGRTFATQDQYGRLDNLLLESFDTGPPVPEPASGLLALLCLGALGCGRARR